MKEIVFVTTNKGKIAYANDVISNTRVIPYEYDLIEPREDDIKVIAETKVRQAYEKTKKPCIAMDIGFFIRQLNGFPRAYVNYALDTIGIEGILKLMEDVDDRYCEFRECLAYYDGDKLELFESIGPAKLSNEIRGTEKEHKLSDLWYIVEPNGFGKTLAEFDDDDFKKHRKHREKSSLSIFGQWYEKHK
jgi:XTP/dITP diphosphohydrolase